jgi:hypothetical protein
MRDKVQHLVYEWVGENFPGTFRLQLEYTAQTGIEAGGPDCLLWRGNPWRGTRVLGLMRESILQRAAGGEY